MRCYVRHIFKTTLHVPRFVPIITSQTTTYHFWKVNFGFLWDKSIHFIQTFFKSHFANFFGFNYTLIIPIQYMTINYNVLIFLYGAIAELRKKTNDTSIILRLPNLGRSDAKAQFPRPRLPEYPLRAV